MMHFLLVLFYVCGVHGFNPLAGNSIFSAGVHNEPQPLGNISSSNTKSKSSCRTDHCSFGVNSDGVCKLDFQTNICLARTAKKCSLSLPIVMAKAISKCNAGCKKHPLGCQQNTSTLPTNTTAPGQHGWMVKDPSKPATVSRPGSVFDVINRQRNTSSVKRQSKNQGRGNAGATFWNSTQTGMTGGLLKKTQNILKAKDAAVVNETKRAANEMTRLLREKKQKQNEAAEKKRKAKEEYDRAQREKAATKRQKQQLEEQKRRQEKLVAEEKLRAKEEYDRVQREKAKAKRKRQQIEEERLIAEEKRRARAKEEYDRVQSQKAAAKRQRQQMEEQKRREEKFAAEKKRRAKEQYDRIQRQKAAAKRQKQQMEEQKRREEKLVTEEKLKAKEQYDRIQREKAAAKRQRQQMEEQKRREERTLAENKRRAMERYNRVQQQKAANAIHRPKNTNQRKNAMPRPKKTKSGKDQMPRPKKTKSGKNAMPRPKKKKSGEDQMPRPKHTKSGKNQVPRPKQTETDQMHRGDKTHTGKVKQDVNGVNGIMVKPNRNVVNQSPRQDITNTGRVTPGRTVNKSKQNALRHGRTQGMSSGSRHDEVGKRRQSADGANVSRDGNSVTKAIDNAIREIGMSHESDQFGHVSKNFNTVKENATDKATHSKTTMNLGKSSFGNENSGTDLQFRNLMDGTQSGKVHDANIPERVDGDLDKSMVVGENANEHIQTATLNAMSTSNKNSVHHVRSAKMSQTGQWDTLGNNGVERMGGVPFIVVMLSMLNCFVIGPD